MLFAVVVCVLGVTTLYSYSATPTGRSVAAAGIGTHQPAENCCCFLSLRAEKELAGSERAFRAVAAQQRTRTHI